MRTGRLELVPLCGIAASRYASTWSVTTVVREMPSPFVGKRIIELGSGTGIVGLLLASMGASVLFTDQACALPLLQHNIDQNREVNWRAQLGQRDRS